MYVSASGSFSMFGVDLLTQWLVELCWAFTYPYKLPSWCWYNTILWVWLWHREWSVSPPGLRRPKRAPLLKHFISNSENLILSGNVVDSIGSPEMTCNSAQVWPGMRLCFESIYTSVGSHRMEVFIHWYKKFSPLPEDFNDFINTVTCGASHAYDSETVLDSIAQYQWRSINDIPVYLQRLWILMLFQFVSELFWLPVSTVVFYFVIPQCLASIATPFFFTYFNLLLWPTLAMSGKDKDSFYTDGLVRMEGRAMARTEEKKRLVLVPALALAQDKIILCTGAVCPLLVRPNPDLRTYQVVGECYMHDWQNDYNMKSCETLVIVWYLAVQKWVESIDFEGNWWYLGAIATGRLVRLCLHMLFKCWRMG